MKNLTNSRSNVKVLWGHLSVSVEARFEGINSICISCILRKIIPSSNGRWKEGVEENIGTGSEKLNIIRVT